jgi:hypothetical protein
MAPHQTDVSENHIDIATSLAPLGVDTGEPSGRSHSNGIQNGDAVGKPKNWIPIAEHVLWKPQRKVKIISIGCGFSGKVEIYRDS